jgi:trehalose utilization protein
MRATRVVVWSEYVSERREAAARAYLRGLHVEVADGIRELLEDAVEVATATVDEPDQGLPASRLEATDVLVWRGHMVHDQVTDATVARVRARVLAGMGLVVLHSGHLSKVFTSLMGTSCKLPLARGLGPGVGLDGEPLAPDRPRGAAPAGDRTARDVRGAVRHPAARVAGLQQLVQRR